MLWMAGVVLASLLVTWGHIALSILMTVDGSLSMPDSVMDYFACRGVEPSRLPSWLPLPDVAP